MKQNYQNDTNRTNLSREDKQKTDLWKIISVKVIRCLKMLSGKFCKCSLMVCPVTWKIWPLGCSSCQQHWNASFSSNFKGAVSITHRKRMSVTSTFLPRELVLRFLHLHPCQLSTSDNRGDSEAISLSFWWWSDWNWGGWREELESDAQYCENPRW